MFEGVDEDKRATLRRFAALGAATPLVRLAESPSTGDVGVREAILGYLDAVPGAHFSKLRDDLQLGTGETQHHVRRLLEAGAVESRRDGDYRRFYPAGQFTGAEQVALGYLRRDTPRGMVLELLQHPAATGSELASSLDVSQSTISKYAAELAEAGLLERSAGYRLTEAETLLVLLVRYADSFDEEATALAARAAELIELRD
ncbi:MAG: MarR family transcriptional regulator [Halobacteriales archaeon]|nr:MarR family transcriptional regulator [Halobacteriales archaeon]